MLLLGVVSGDRTTFWCCGVRGTENTQKTLHFQSTPLLFNNKPGGGFRLTGVGTSFIFGLFDTLSGTSGTAGLFTAAPSFGDLFLMLPEIRYSNEQIFFNLIGGKVPALVTLVGVKESPAPCSLSSGRGALVALIGGHLRRGSGLPLSLRIRSRMYVLVFSSYLHLFSSWVI
jgi:hypothetical protein